MCIGGNNSSSEEVSGFVDSIIFEWLEPCLIDIETRYDG